MKKIYPESEKSSIQKILIAPHGADASLVSAGYFDSILTLETIFDKKNWD